MKKRLTIMMLMLWAGMLHLSGQQLSAAYQYTISSYNHFSRMHGFALGAGMQTGKRGQVSITFSYNANSKAFTDTFFADYNGKTYLQHINPQNLYYQFSAAYTLDLIPSPKWALRMGPQLALGYYYFNEHFTQTELGQSQTDTLHYEFWDGKNRFTLGLSLSAERLLTQNVSLFVSWQPSLVFYTKSLMDGSAKPSRITMTAWATGLVYHLKTADEGQERKNELDL